jgi:oxidase EvaA
MTPKVTIIISAYGFIGSLQQTLESVYRQTFKSWRCILIADCCEKEFFNQLGQIDQRVTVINLPVHCGHQYGPNSIGVHLANSEYLAFLNQDDLWTQDHLERAMAAIVEERLDAYFGRAAFCHPSGQSSWPYGVDPLRFSEYNRPEYYWRSLFGPFYFFEPTSAWVIKTSVAKAVGDWLSPDKTDLTPVMDWFSRLVRESKKFFFSQVVTVLKINLRNPLPEEQKIPIYFRQPIGKEKLLGLLYENPRKLRSRIVEEIKNAKENGLLVRNEMTGVLPLDDLEKKRQAIFEQFLNNDNVDQPKKVFAINPYSWSEAQNTYLIRTGRILHKCPEVAYVNKLLLTFGNNKSAALEPSVKKITFAECEGWTYTENKLKHKTGRFFSLQIVESFGNEYVYINQPEVGVLGFILIDDGSEVRWLMQAKAEPGNVGLVQYAPTVQATRSNYERVHGGSPTPYLELFLDNKVDLLVDVHGSEQGDRFINKFNRNIKIRIAKEDKKFSKLHQFELFSKNEVKAMLKTDYVLNTDARSVIASGAWSVLCEFQKEMFFGCSVSVPHLSKALTRSMQQKKAENLDKARAVLENVPRHQTTNFKTIPWSQSKTFSFTKDGIYRTNGESAVGFYDCILPNREVGRWQQPLLEKISVGLYGSLIKVVDGVALFGARAEAELGFLGRAEFTVIIKEEYPDFIKCNQEILDQDRFGRILLSIKQSDEGGRFWRNEACYAIFLVEGHEKACINYDVTWFTLGDLEALTVRSGMVTNELRTVISLLLSLA